MVSCFCRARCRDVKRNWYSIARFGRSHRPAALFPTQGFLIVANGLLPQQHGQSAQFALRAAFICRERQQRVLRRLPAQVRRAGAHGAPIDRGDPARAPSHPTERARLRQALWCEAAADRRHDRDQPAISTLGRGRWHWREPVRPVRGLLDRRHALLDDLSCLLCGPGRCRASRASGGCARSGSGSGRRDWAACDRLGLDHARTARCLRRLPPL